VASDLLKSKLSLSTFLFAVTSLFAVCLQIQLTLFSTPSYMGLRVNLADLFLPFVGVVVGLSLLLRKSQWPQWQVKYLYLWLAGLFLVLTIALVKGYMEIGYWSSWALINKYIGFLILCAYFFLGGWIVKNSSHADQIITRFMNVFCGFCVIVLAASTVLIFLQIFSDYDLWLSNFAWDGFMANRNAFMIVVVFVMICLMCNRKELSFARAQWMHHLFWALLPIFFLYNASRTGWIAMVIILILYLVEQPVQKLKFIGPFILLGVLIATASFYTPVVPMNEKKRQFMRILTGYELTTPEDEKILNVEGDQHRLIAVEDGFDLYKQSNPVIGAGLGSYKEFQIKKRGEFINLIDFTALWLLVETGALGLGAFAAFFVVCAAALYRSGLKEDDVFRKAMFFYLIAFAGMAVTHELMYSRFLWFAMGLALVQVGNVSSVAARLTDPRR
jgi:O-antigen ligase